MTRENPTELTEALLRERLSVLQRRIVDAGGTLESTRVLAVTKTFPAAVARLAATVGLFELGENYGQELAEKAPELADTPVRWHFIGALQRNKVRKIARYVSVWQTVDRVELATEIAKRAPEASILIQVNTTDEAQKSGCSPSSTPELVDRCRELGLEVQGLMTIGPTDGSTPGPAFARLRELRDRLGLEELSMGMSGDLELAVAEGSTMIRVGTALFGPR